MTITTHPTPAEEAMDRALGVASSRTWDHDARMPLLPRRGDGAHFWDADGRELIDLTSCTGAAPLGMNHRPTIEAMIEELNTSGGVLPGTMSELRTRTAELLVEIFPCAERALFFRTGSCATSGAARLARVRTGRRLVLSAGFHGWHDWQLQYKGDPEVTDRDPDCLDFGYDLDLLRDLVARHRGEVAAVFVTPESTCMPMADLAEMQRIAHEDGALFMMDEIITGSRFVGGLHAALGLEPDMITISKGLANGAALSAVIGGREALLAQEQTYLGNTFMRETTPFAGALVSLPEMHRHGGIEAMTARVGELAAHYRAAFAQVGVRASVVTGGGLFHVLFEDEDQGALFHQRLREAGVHTEHKGTHLPPAAITDEDVETVRSAVLHAAAAVAGPGGGGGIGREAFARFSWDAFRVGQATSDRWWESNADVQDRVDEAVAR